MRREGYCLNILLYHFSFLNFVSNFRLAIDSNEIKYIFWIADHDSDGRITYEEFIELFMNYEKSGRKGAGSI